ncbi:MAG TPA: hypothetical protein VF406_20330 [Thermodesulfobacteriota bacterium]
MPVPSRQALVRDVVALAVLAALVLGGVSWWRAAAAARLWRTVALEAEGLRFRLPPDWTVTSLGYADADFSAGRPDRGIVLAVRSFAIPPEMRRTDGDQTTERAALEAWAAGLRAAARQGRRLHVETSLRVGGVRGVLQVFEDRRDALPVSVVAAAAREGRLYSFQAQAGSSVRPRDAARTVRRILRTVEWIERTAPTG